MTPPESGTLSRPELNKKARREIDRAGAASGKTRIADRLDTLKTAHAFLRDARLEPNIDSIMLVAEFLESE